MKQEHRTPVAESPLCFSEFSVVKGHRGVGGCLSVVGFFRSPKTDLE